MISALINYLFIVVCVCVCVSVRVSVCECACERVSFCFISGCHLTRKRADLPWLKPSERGTSTHPFPQFFVYFVRHKLSPPPCLFYDLCVLVYYTMEYGVKG